MNVDRMTRVNSLLKREIGTAIIHSLIESTLDASSVTVVEVQTSRDLQNVRVKVSIRDDQQQRRPILSFLRHHHGLIQEQVSRNVVLKYTPRIFFELDHSIEKGDRVLDILSRIPVPEDVPEATFEDEAKREETPEEAPATPGADQPEGNPPEQP